MRAAYAKLATHEERMHYLDLYTSTFINDASKSKEGVINIDLDSDLAKM